MENKIVGVIPNLLDLDDKSCKVYESCYPKCQKECKHYEEAKQCNGCNNYEFTHFWRIGKEGNGNKRK